MKYTKDFHPLCLPDFFRFGIELEAFNVKTKGKNSLYTGKSAKYITDKHWYMATKREEALVGKGGAELVSPILKDTPSDWLSVIEICEHIKKYPRKSRG